MPRGRSSSTGTDGSGSPLPPALGNGRSWDAERVCLRLTEAFEEVRHVSFYCASADELEPISPTADREGLELIRLVCGFLADDGLGREMLLTWARAMSMPREVRPSAREICRERGWATATFASRRHKAALHVASCLNAARSRGP